MDAVLKNIQEENSIRVPNPTIVVDQRLQLPSPSFPVLQLKYATLKVNSKRVKMKPKYYQRPDYVSYDFYGTTTLWHVILYVNDCSSFNEFTMDEFLVPDTDLVMTMLSQYPELEEIPYTVNTIGTAPNQLVANMQFYYYIPDKAFVNDDVTCSIRGEKCQVQLSYTWSWGDGTFDKTYVGKAIHSYRNPGLYTITVVVSDGTTSKEFAHEICIAPTWGPVIKDIVNIGTDTYQVDFIKYDCLDYTYTWYLNGSQLSSTTDTVILPSGSTGELTVKICDENNYCNSLAKTI